MIYLKIMALSILIPMWIFGIERAIRAAAKGQFNGYFGLVCTAWLIVTGTTAGAIIETML